MDPLDPATDPWLRAELEAARAWGVSWRRFCGWEPVRTTTYEYDDQGRVARAVTVTEPEWDDTGREAVYALMRFEADLCPGCRQPLTETAAPENEFLFRESGTVRCHRCVAVATAQKGYEHDPHPEALLVGVELRKETDGDGPGG